MINFTDYHKFPIRANNVTPVLNKSINIFDGLSSF